RGHHAAEHIHIDDFEESLSIEFEKIVIGLFHHVRGLDRVVIEHVDAAKFGNGVIDHALQLAFHAAVDRHADRATAGLADIVRRGSRRFSANIGGDNRRTFLRKSQRGGPPDTAAGARDYANLFLQPWHITRLLSKRGLLNRKPNIYRGKNTLETVARLYTNNTRRADQCRINTQRRAGSYAPREIFLIAQILRIHTQVEIGFRHIQPINAAVINAVCGDGLRADRHLTVVVIVEAECEFAKIGCERQLIAHSSGKRLLSGIVER